MTCVWLFIAVEVRWVGERLPSRPKADGWWLCWLGADVIANGRFDEQRVHLMAIACRDKLEADEKYSQISRQVQIPSGTVLVQRINAKDYARFVKEDEAFCKSLNEQFYGPVYLGPCLDNQRSKK